MARKADRLSPLSPLAVDPERENRVRERAYLMWEADGKPHGRDVEYWERARELVGVDERAAGGSLPNQQNRPQSRGETGLEAKSEIQHSLGKFPGRVADQDEIKTTPNPKRKSRSKTK